MSEKFDTASLHACIGNKIAKIDDLESKEEYLAKSYQETVKTTYMAGGSLLFLLGVIGAAIYGLAFYETFLIRVILFSVITLCIVMCVIFVFFYLHLLREMKALCNGEFANASEQQITLLYEWVTLIPDVARFLKTAKTLYGCIPRDIADELVININKWSEEHDMEGMNKLKYEAITRKIDC